ncbi:MAG TPA: ABC transporter permease [Vicinamibacterales bacterium]|nr:ABC transporter permease [Vicinamibacterales bacterium]
MPMTFQQDLRYALRSLRRTSGFTAIVVLTLGLGIGSNTAIFSLADQMLLRMLPVHRPDELVTLDGPGAFRGRTFNRATFSYPMYRDFRDKNAVFAGVIGRFPSAVTFTYDGQPERVTGELVTGNYFDVLGVRPALGRLFTTADDRTPGAHPVAVLSHGFWKRRFGLDASILNKPVSINGHPMTIVGVTQAGFSGLVLGESPDVMVPIMMKPQMTPTWSDLDNRQSRWLNVVARLKPGISIEQARAAMNVLYRQINEQEIKEARSPSPTFAKRFVEKTLVIEPAGRGPNIGTRRDAATPLFVMFGMVGVVLLIACANVANLLIAKLTARQKEIAVRAAIGAGRWQIVRQYLLESLVLAFAGGVVGLAIASWTTSLLVGAMPIQDVVRSLSVAPDARVLVFTLALCGATALLFGLVPAIQASRPVLTNALKDDIGTTSGGARSARARKVLVVAQVALSVLLLAAAGLFARSLYNLRTLDPGFKIDRLLTFSIDPTLSSYTQERTQQFAARLHESLLATAGVAGATAAEVPALTDSTWSMTVQIDGYKRREDENMNPVVNGIGPRYFATMGIPLVAGREFDERDTLAAPRVAIINETMAKKYWGNSSPLGRRFGFGPGKPTDIEIVGVVKDSKHATLREEVPRFVYIPYMQNDSLTALTFYVRASGAPQGVVGAIRGAVQRIDPALPVYDVKTMEVQARESLFVERIMAGLSVAFGVLATLLAAVGLYGVMSYTVARRVREIGIRMALGADRGRVFGLILREVGVMAVAGIVAGLAATAALVKVMGSQVAERMLFGLSAADPATIAVTTTVLALVALLAGFVPARRATGIDPMRALRAE